MVESKSEALNSHQPEPSDPRGRRPGPWAAGYMVIVHHHRDRCDSGPRRVVRHKYMTVRYLQRAQLASLGVRSLVTITNSWPSPPSAHAMIYSDGIE